jgi:GGDEF domain-containing protein
VPGSPVLHFAPDDRPLPPAVRAWVEGLGLPVLPFAVEDELMAAALRSRPRLVVADGRGDAVAACQALRRLKADSYTGVIPSLLVCRDEDEALRAGFAAGADEVLRDATPALETALRLDLLLRRSDRDTLVHPTTRLPGTVEIEMELTRRLAGRTSFAMCYADLDHFKEYNDRYSYYEGDRVIRILARILHDVVKGLCGEPGFVGHIGGDDFIFLVPVDAVPATCGAAIEVFDALIPWQYSEQDRRAGYFFGKDRRGQLHRVPLMTLSIGVVTTERRRFTSAAQIGELATEMKSYAKTLPGSVYSVDRRADPPAGGTGPSEGRARSSDALEVQS